LPAAGEPFLRPRRKREEGFALLRRLLVHGDLVVEFARLLLDADAAEGLIWLQKRLSLRKIERAE
jgi:hypothetical protein